GQTGREAEARMGAGNSARSLTERRRQTMKNIQAIIGLFGGLASFRHVRLECKGFMPLAVEAIGPGPRGLPMVSVAHYYSQNGDAMRDPEMVFEVDGAGQFHPVSFQQNNLGIYHEAVDTDDAGQV